MASSGIPNEDEFISFIDNVTWRGSIMLNWVGNPRALVWKSDQGIGFEIASKRSAWGVSLTFGTKESKYAAQVIRLFFVDYKEFAVLVKKLIKDGYITSKDLWGCNTMDEAVDYVVKIMNQSLPIHGELTFKQYSK
jgi:hypothetical protein